MDSKLLSYFTSAHHAIVLSKVYVPLLSVVEDIQVVRLFTKGGSGGQKTRHSPQLYAMLKPIGRERLNGFRASAMR